MHLARRARRSYGVPVPLVAAALLVSLLPRLSAAQSITTSVAPNVVVGQSDSLSENSTAAGSRFDYPRGFAFDAQGNLWVADSANGRLLSFEGYVIVVTLTEGTSSTSTSSTSATTSSQSSSTTSSQPSSKSTTTSAGSGSGGVPEFSAGAGPSVAVSALLVVSYAFARKFAPVKG